LPPKKVVHQHLEHHDLDLRLKRNADWPSGHWPAGANEALRVVSRRSCGRFAQSHGTFPGWNRLARLNGSAEHPFLPPPDGPIRIQHPKSSPVARAIPAVGLVSLSNWPGFSPVAASTALMTAGSRVNNTGGNPAT